jgi:hypothetical protein
LGGDAKVFDVEFAEVAEVVDVDDEVVEMDLGIVLTMVGKPEDLFKDKEGPFSLIGLFFAGLCEKGVGNGRPCVAGVGEGGFNTGATGGWIAVGKGLLDPEDGLSVC